MNSLCIKTNNEDILKYLQNEFSNFNKLSLFERKFKHRYYLFTKEELNTIFNDCVNYIIKEIIKLGDNKNA